MRCILPKWHTLPFSILPCTQSLTLYIRPISSHCIPFILLITMESPYKSNENAFEGEEKVLIKSGRSINIYELLLRLLVLVITLVAVIVMGVAKGTGIANVSIIPNMPPLAVPVKAKPSDLSSNVYFMVSNAVASFYGLVSLILLLANGSKTNIVAATITIVDLLVVAILFSANGAVAGVGIIGLKGNSHLHWEKICNIFGPFCRQLTASVVLSIIGSSILLLLVALSVLNLHKRSK